LTIKVGIAACDEAAATVKKANKTEKHQCRRAMFGERLAVTTFMIPD
jgi:hypothetical protein